MGEVLGTVGEDSTHRAQEDPEARSRGEVLETCVTTVAEESYAEERVEGEVRTVNSGQWSVNSGQ